MANALASNYMAETSGLTPERERKYQRVFDQRKVTPLHCISRIPIPNGNRIWAKEEYIGNPTQSVFDRVYPELFRSLESRGLIVPGVTPVIECSVGNAGASFAWAASQLGYEATVIINADSPKARVEQIESFGATIILSPATEYGNGYVKLLDDLLKQDAQMKGGKVGQNPERLFAVTKILPEARNLCASLAAEAVSQLGNAGGSKCGFDLFVSAVGSGDLISGVSAYLRRFNNSFKSVALEPAELPALSALRNGQALPYRPLSMDKFLIGVTASAVPEERLNIDFSCIDMIEKVTVDEWRSAEAELLTLEGKAVGRTSCAAFATAKRLSSKLEGKDILIVFYDPQWKYGDKAPIRPSIVR